VHTKDFPLGEIRGQISGEGEADEEEGWSIDNSTTLDWECHTFLFYL
jgi:hypothetical protein